MTHDSIRGPILLSLTLLVGTSSGCLDGGRLPVCKTDADCAPKEGEVAAGPICYDLRCVQCRYDDDCEMGHICSSALACERLSPKPPKEPKRRKRPKPKSCVESCAEDEACIAECAEKPGQGEPGEDAPE